MKDEADQQVYAILDAVTGAVTGSEKHFEIGRQENTLRRRLERENAEFLAAGIPVAPLRMDLTKALEIAAENSRDFQRQKESLYRTALNLTRSQFDFEVQWFGGNSSEVSGVGDDSATATISQDLRAQLNTTNGTRIVGSFVNTFLKDLVNGGDFDGSSIFNFSITQPLLRGARRRVVRESLTQSERDVVYAVRSFERFRETLALQVTSTYLNVLQQQQNLESVRRNLESVRRNESLIQALFDADRRAIVDVDRSTQSVLQAENNVANAVNALQTAQDNFKFQLGLTIDTPIELDPTVFDNVIAIGIEPVDLPQHEAIRIALERRYDYRNTADQVDDAVRQVLVAEDGLRSIIDFSSAVAIPTEPGKPLKFDFGRVQWSAGFNIDLALAVLPERNVHRAAIIALDNALRTREQAEDEVKQDIRNDLRNITNRIRNYEIAKLGVDLNARRVDSTSKLYEAGRAQALDVLDAQNDLLSAELQLIASVVDYAVSRLQLLLDLEAIELDPYGVTLELGLPLPTGVQDTEDARRALERRKIPRNWETDTPWRQLHDGFGGTESDPDGTEPEGDD